MVASLDGSAKGDNTLTTEERLRPGSGDSGGGGLPQRTRAYEELFRGHILPGLRDIVGFVDAYVLRKDLEDEVQITTITLFESMEGIRVFAGEDPTKAHVTPEARRLLSRFEDTVVHHDVVIAPQTF
jgi:heme-degrading monooxygenase HmoA